LAPNFNNTEALICSSYLYLSIPNTIEAMYIPMTAIRMSNVIENNLITGQQVIRSISK